ncbi:alpha/beta hydrolase [Polymorphobacter sp. PAMC 29334]|uniref:alpha/beta fold hydrolase n=1 Tax=Polymorphobacter sp. PAMC 29334 TaxID=2862331 RepID=UPI001C66EF8F|nr:alpha/beta hydrolase [Polymorphobacter sp. PAMC 29334]QYE34783.1 alpha/beta hydrolase [Polymorphobacter sp. PAMC 29334]
MFDDFTRDTFDSDGVDIAYWTAGSGPPLLLIHGYPQTHVMWHKLAPALAERFTVVAPDLRGYGDSAKPAGDTDHGNYSKRVMANDLAGVMASLGHDRFAVAGHDRGARVAYRMALDHGDSVERVAVLDIVPTKKVYDATDRALATGYFHWFFLIQRQPIPENLIGGAVDTWLDMAFGNWAGVKDAFTPEARAEYRRTFATPESDPRDLRVLPRRGNDRLRQRLGNDRRGRQDRRAAAGLVGRTRAGCGARPAGDMARLRRRRPRPQPRLRPFPPRGAARGDAGRAARLLRMRG